MMEDFLQLNFTQHLGNSTGRPFVPLEYQSATLSPGGYHAIAAYLTCIGVMATAGNILVIIVIATDRKLKAKSQNLLLLNLAVSDLGISVFGYPFTTASAYAGHWVFGTDGCTASGALCTILALTDIHTLTALSVYRYLIVCKPHLNYYVENAWLTKMTCAICWLVSVAWGVAALLGWNSIVPEAYGTACSINWAGRTPGDISYTVTMIFLSYLLCIAIMAFCYYKVFRESSRVYQSMRDRRTFTPDDAILLHKTKCERRVSWMSLLMVLSFVIIWSPYAWASMWVIVDPLSVPLWVITLPTMFAKCSCCVNPPIYFATNPRFREALARCTCLRGRATVTPTLPMFQRRGSGDESDVYTINMTKDGIYIGARTVRLDTHTTGF